jgi:hypothetical protein
MNEIQNENETMKLKNEKKTDRQTDIFTFRNIK